MQKQIFTGKSLEDALEQAAKSLQTERSFVSYNVLPNAKEGGLLSRLFQRSVKVEAWVEHQTEDLQEAARAAVRQAIQKDQSKSTGVVAHKITPQKSPITPPAQAQGNTSIPKTKPNKGPAQKHPINSVQVDSKKHHTDRPSTGERKKFQQPLSRLPANANQFPQSIGAEDSHPSDKGPPREPGLDFSSTGAFDALKEFSELFCKAFEVNPSHLNLSKTDRNDAIVSIDDVFLESLLQKTDRLSLAFEHLFKRFAQKNIGDISSRITLDALNASRNRDEALQAMALSMANKVRETGKSITLVSRSPLERRAVHLALDGAEGVATRSVGSGDHRKLVIYSTLRNANPDQRQKGTREQKPRPQLANKANTQNSPNEGARAHNPKRRKRKPMGQRPEVNSNPQES